MTVAEIKASVRARDGYRCVHCGMTHTEHKARYRRGLEVHRLVPRLPYHVDSCITVCKPCHAKMPTVRTTLTGPFVQARVCQDIHDMARAVCMHTKLPNGTRLKLTDFLDSILRPAVKKAYEEAVQKTLEKHHAAD